eukprot:3452863-Karenia_brevis.AAC.1
MKPEDQLGSLWTNILVKKFRPERFGGIKERTLCKSEAYSVENEMNQAEGFTPAQWNRRCEICEP